MLVFLFNLRRLLIEVKIKCLPLPINFKIAIKKKIWKAIRSMTRVKSIHIIFGPKIEEEI